MRDRAHLLATLRDYRAGKAPTLPETELAALVESIERRLETIRTKLKAIDTA